MKSATAQIVSGVILIVLGILLAVGWFLAHNDVTSRISEYEIKQNLVVESTKSKGYENWAQDFAIDNPNWYEYYMWNLSNVEEVLAGGQPEFTQVGPYRYRYIWYNKNATFSDGGNVVTYNLIEDYIFDADGSVGDPMVDVITNMNPAYLGIIEEAGGDYFMMLGATTGVIGSFLEFCTGPYLNVLLSQSVPATLSEIVTQIQANVSTQEGLNSTEALEYFYGQWTSAATAPPTMEPWGSNMLLSPYNNDTDTGISLASAELLFTPSQELSLLNNSTLSIMTWLLATNNITGPEAESLITTFGLTSEQLGVVCNWRNNSLLTPYVIPSIMNVAVQHYPTAQWGSDVGWVQYVTAAYTPGSSISTLYSQWFPQYSPAAFELPGYKVIMNVSTAMNFYVGPYGILDVLNFEVYAEEVKTTQNYTQFGITAVQGAEFFGYINKMSGLYTYPLVAGLIAEGTGLIVTQTVNYWLWTCEDPLLAFLLGPSLAYCGLQNNHTVQPPSSIYTGKNDMSQLGMYISWRNQTTVPYWSEPIPVNGSTDNGQFPPSVKKDQVLSIWDENFLKTIYFNQIGNGKVKDIDTYLYALNETTFAASTFYTNTIEGFANETLFNQAPIYLSNWDLYGVEPQYANVTGMQPNASDITTVHVEPTTGSTIQADNKLQINLFYGPGSSALNQRFAQWVDVPDNQFYPLVKIYQMSQVGEKTASQMKKDLLFVGHPFNEGLLWGLVGLGSVLALVGLVVLIRGVQHKRNAGYSEIQDR